MTTEDLAAPGAAAEVPAPATPELESPQVEGQQPESTESPAETEAEKEAKALKAMQRRIDKRTRDLYAERARAEQLERELAALKNGATSPESVPDVETLAEKRARELVEQQTLQSRVRDTLEKGRALEGFDDAVNAVVEDLDLMAGGKPTAQLRALLDTDAPHELIHYLRGNPEALDSLQGLSPERFAYRLARIETQMQAAKQPQRSKAPQPLKTVAPQASTSELSADLPMDEWMRRREQQLKERRGY